jgi:hypothetical protein
LPGGRQHAQQNSAIQVAAAAGIELMNGVKWTRVRMDERETKHDKGKNEDNEDRKESKNK